MNARLYFSTDGSMPIEPIEELSVVSLKKPLETDEGFIPSGTEGVVVSVYGEGAAYCVEFEQPFHAVVTVECDFIDAVAGKSRADLSRSIGATD